MSRFVARELHIHPPYPQLHTHISTRTTDTPNIPATHKHTQIRPTYSSFRSHLVISEPDARARISRTLSSAGVAKSCPPTPRLCSSFSAASSLSDDTEPLLFRLAIVGLRAVPGDCLTIPIDEVVVVVVIDAIPAHAGENAGA